MSEDDFTPGDATDVAHKCTIATTLNNHPLVPNDTLANYGVSTSEQILLIKTRIRTNKEFGLPRYGRSIEPNALKDLDNGVTIANLSNLLFDQSFDDPSALPMFDGELESASGAKSRAKSSEGSASMIGNAIVDFTRRNPVQALALSAGIGMLLGLILGSTRR